MMRVVVKEKLVLTKEMFEEALDCSVSSMSMEGSYVRLVAKRGTPKVGYKEVIIYLRCADVKSLLGIHVNIFDFDDGVYDKTKGTFTVEYEKEVLRKKFSFRRLRKTLEKYLGAR